jgi:hypothetical protein
MKMETLAYKIQTPGNYPEESIQHSEELLQKLVGQTEGKWPLGRNWCKMQNIKTNIKEAGNESDRSITLAHGRNKCRVFVTKETKRRVTFKEWEFLQLLSEKNWSTPFHRLLQPVCRYKYRINEIPKSSLP